MLSTAAIYGQICQKRKYFRKSHCICFSPKNGPTRDWKIIARNYHEIFNTYWYVVKVLPNPFVTVLVLVAKKNLISTMSFEACCCEASISGVIISAGTESTTVGLPEMTKKWHVKPTIIMLKSALKNNLKTLVNFVKKS